MAGFQSKTGLTPQPVREQPVKELTIAELQKEARAKKQAKSQPKKPVKPLIIKEQPQKATKGKTQDKKNAAETSRAEAVSRVRTRSQASKEKGKAIAVEESPASKASLKDLLEAIEFEQIESMHIDLTQSSPESAKKTKASKRLRFDEPAQEFVFKPRRPLTRNFQQVQEALPKTEEKEKETRP